jgi:hypothetical protein
MLYDAIWCYMMLYDVMYLENVNGGIPQGSKIGPLAFVIKINSL